MEMEYKNLPIAEVKIRDDGSGSIEGYASTFGNWDDMGERVARGAFAKHLDTFLQHGFVAVGHSWHELPVATPTMAIEDDYGLKVAADFHSTQHAQNTRITIKERLDRGKSVRLSIGFMVRQDEYTSEGRVLKEVELFEWSYVTVPANPAALVTGAKSGMRLRLEDHHDSALAAVSGLIDRYKAVVDLRLKAGRTLSSENRRKIEAAIASLADAEVALKNLLETSDKPDEDAKELHALRMRLIRSTQELRKAGVML